MPSEVPPPLAQDSNRPLLIEVVFASQDEKQTFPLQLDFFESMTVTLLDKGAVAARLTLFDRTGDFLLGLMAAAGVNRRIFLRWGWDNPRGLLLYPRYVMDYVQFTPEFTPEGTRIEFNLVSALAYEQRLDTRQGGEPRVFKAGLTIAEAVDQIAQSRGWKTHKTINGTQEDMVAPTPGALTEDLVQKVGQSDFEFILQELLPRANDSTGRGDYRFFFDAENVLHFHTPDLVLLYVKEYTYIQNVAGEVISFAPEDNTYEAAILGGAEAIYWGIDSLTGQRLRIASSGERGLPDRRVQIEASGAALMRLLPKDGIDGVPAKDLVNAHKVVLARTVEDFNRKVRARFDKLRKEAYKATAEVLGTHVAGPLDHLKFNVYLGASGQPHFLGGIYTVLGVEHEVSAGGWQTRFSLQREGVSKVPAARTVEGDRRQLVAGFFASEDALRVYEAGRKSGTITVPVLES